MSIQRRVAAFALAVGLSTMPVIAETAAPVSVKVNMARILRISAPANTVIIGNPKVADVTIQDPQTLVLTGKSYGQTNMIVLDAQGNAIADTLVEVVQAQADIVTVYMGSARTTLACAPVCQPTIMLGDDPGFTSTTASSSAIVTSP
jgi:Flp pilus assembly secretin CpaC